MVVAILCLGKDRPLIPALQRIRQGQRGPASTERTPRPPKTTPTTATANNHHQRYVPPLPPPPPPPSPPAAPAPASTRNDCDCCHQVYCGTMDYPGEHMAGLVSAEAACALQLLMLLSCHRRCMGVIIFSLAIATPTTTATPQSAQPNPHLVGCIWSSS